MNNIIIKNNIPNFITLSNLFLGFTSIVLLALSINSTIEYIKIDDARANFRTRFFRLGTSSRPPESRGSPQNFIWSP